MKTPLPGNKQFAAILNSCKEAILHCSPAGKVEYYNVAYAQLVQKNFGTKIQQGKIVYNLLPKKYRLGLQRLYTKTLTGVNQDVVFFHILDSGNISIFEITLSPVHEANRVTGVVEIIRDVTKKMLSKNRIGANISTLRKQITKNGDYYLDSNIALSMEVNTNENIEEILKENKEWLAQIIQSTSIPTYVIDKNHTITHWNKACELLTGKNGAEMIGTKDQWKPFYSYNRPTLADLVLDLAPEKKFRKYYSNRFRRSLMENAFEAEGFFNFQTGEKWLFFTAAPLKGLSGDIIGAIETFQDITARKKMEEEVKGSHKILVQRIEERTEQLKLTYNQLLHAEKLSAVGKLAASIAHEFGNPIIGIRNFLKGLLKDSSICKEDREVIEIAIIECQRVKELISNLQDFNRPTSGTLEALDLHKAINDMLLFYKKDLKEKHIKIIKKYSKTLPLIEAVPDQIKQVILNCLNNAAESITDTKGTITIKTEVSPENNILLHISDTGKGIKKEDLEYIFDPFFSTKPAVEGTGLGLSVSYGIVKRHCGKIQVTDTSKRGTTFTITLPTKQ